MYSFFYHLKKMYNLVSVLKQRNFGRLNLVTFLGFQMIDIFILNKNSLIVWSNYLIINWKTKLFVAYCKNSYVMEKCFLKFFSQ